MSNINKKLNKTLCDALEQSVSKFSDYFMVCPSVETESLESQFDNETIVNINHKYLPITITGEILYFNGGCHLELGFEKISEYNNGNLLFCLGTADEILIEQLKKRTDSDFFEDPIKYNQLLLDMRKKVHEGGYKQFEDFENSLLEPLKIMYNIPVRNIEELKKTISDFELKEFL
ncbi:hypothetical protein HOK68_01955 [Candidatus Woesearchaeota archaeon]|jgi:hypothetical protein|nr:hypothetical protein [Candidatus Woesearchaeota archaeon]MBT4387604.1 hypothetical protein [Candidatus Woesearchaeota archaeon]MBT4596034.1 hypothetical protein [Candidatus Woesearchaeota archaeon]MBT5740742.1 hypothetical protein [Candidatus Woesearchaeota archaeon]MBT6505522.1 hypothetical protein [Candidatus Woesearchaeota archaeon]